MNQVRNGKKYYNNSFAKGPQNHLLRSDEEQECKTVTEIINAVHIASLTHDLQAYQPGPLPAFPVS